MRNSNLTTDEIYEHHISNQRVDEKLDKLTKRLVMDLRGKPEVVDDVLKFSKGIEEIISEYQYETYMLAFELINSIKLIHSTVKVMELYGVDSSEALSGWRCDEHLNQEHDFATKSGIYKIPEKTKALLKMLIKTL